eukprot:TRINITY_DN11823_c0_g1::TRINITY_DN11823_c0_g1_i1::g.16528::m.16528 TRINITY_DN11823_c0_g1::TRINITY_DN11823_c0_g1_i1::g.16528  ORF type:complete len:503 (+),score=8.30,sp/O54862/MBTP2_CRIGR/32.48/1e-60,Peptidase_M50/PF02163.17/3.4e+02,Peptidase_M50/PF02163.17/2.2e-13,PDZ_2/PF13180.1/0.00042,PDZ/PF00595.19/0.011 TRINITY_DN11823_c0_g1_i1:62-1510(+)
MSFLGGLIIFWVLVFVVHRNLEAKIWYRRFLEENHLKLGFGFVTWYTLALNETLYYFGRRRQRFLSIWFSIGVVVGAIGFLASISLLVYNLYHLLTSPPDTPQVLTPLVPGMNLPTNHLGYVFLAILISVVTHELGHAIAAGSEGIHILKCGLFFVAVFPGAFVSVHQDVSSCSLYKQLKIYCAGSWHNLMATTCCGFFLKFLPSLLLVLYTTRHGAVITRISPDSPFQGHIFPGDIIVAVNDCPVIDTDGFNNCILDCLERDQTSSYCFESNALVSSTDECCQPDYPGSLQCFYSSMTDIAASLTYCLPANTVIDLPFCLTDDDCSSMNTPESHHSCLRPLTQEHQQLITVKLSNGTTLLFMGYPQGLYYTMITSNYVVRYPILESQWLIELDLPRIVEKSLRYTASVSLALALLNMAPVFWLDGEISSALFLTALFPNSDQAHLESARKVLVSCGTGLLLLNVFFSFFSISTRYTHPASL